MGAQRRRGQRRRRLQRLGRPRTLRWRGYPASGNCSSRNYARHALQVRDPLPATAASAVKADPYAFYAKLRRAPLRSSGTSIQVRRTRLDGRAPRTPIRCAPVVDLRSASRLVAAGAARRAIARSPTASWRPRLADTVRDWASPTSSCCRSWSIRSTAPGATRSPAISRRPPLRHAATTSCTSSITCTSAGIGVILDWVPAHFPTDAHRPGAASTAPHLYEHADPRKGAHPDWNSSIFNYGRNEVRSFLSSNALFWLDAITSTACAWTPSPPCSTSITRASPANGSPTITAAARTSRPSSFCSKFNRASTRNYPGVHDHRRGIHRLADGLAAGLPRRARLRLQMEHGLDARHAATIFEQDPIHRRYHHNDLTFRMLYAFTENFVLPLSHDEVVHGKGSLLAQDAGRRLAEVRQSARCCSATCGRSRARSCSSWAASSASGANGTTTQSLDWHLLRVSPTRGLQRLVRDLNRLYRATPRCASST